MIEAKASNVPEFCISMKTQGLYDVFGPTINPIQLRADLMTARGRVDLIRGAIAVHPSLSQGAGCDAVIRAVDELVASQPCAGTITDSIRGLWRTMAEDSAGKAEAIGVSHDAKEGGRTHKKNKSRRMSIAARMAMAARGVE